MKSGKYCSENLFVFKVLLKSDTILMLWWILSDRQAKVSMGHFKEKSNVDFLGHFSQRYCLVIICLQMFACYCILFIIYYIILYYLILSSLLSSLFFLLSFLSLLSSLFLLWLLLVRLLDSFLVRFSASPLPANPRPHANFQKNIKI